MEISVIIPVYNAAAFVEKAVESALQFDEVKEVLLVEDASPDNALEICQELEKKYQRVKLFQHPDKKNHGAGASRNLGIKNASCPFIAFLDADDFYLPNRFDADKEVFKKNMDADGVYSATGYFYSSELGRKKFKKIGFEGLVSFPKEILPKELPFVLLGARKIKGNFIINSLTVKKKLVLQCGSFNEKLRLHQDSDLNIKLSIKGKLYPGELIKPVSLYRAHDLNRITQNHNFAKTKTLFYKELLMWAKNIKIQKDLTKIIESHYLFNKALSSSYYEAVIIFIYGIAINRRFLTNTWIFQNVFYKLFGKNSFSKFLVKVKEKLQLTIFKYPIE